MTFVDTVSISYDDICLIPRYSNLNSRFDAKINVNSNRNPIINAPMIHTSSKLMIRYLVLNNMLTTVHRYFKNAIDQINWVRDAVSPLDDSDIYFHDIYFAVGVNRSWIDELMNNGIDKFLIDLAHGHSQHCYDTIKYIRKKSPNSVIIAGNVATGQGYMKLIEHGADMVRVGIAGGSICSTAKATAFGLPMVTSLLDCYKVKKEIGGIIIADGGIRSSADMLKAIACGADYCMVGKILASTSLAEGPFYDNEGNILNIDWLPFTEGDITISKCEYFGMASKEARDYNSTHSSKGVAIEGESGLIAYTGTTSDIINNIEANLRSGLSYNGSHNWQHFHDNVIITRISTAGQIEKLTHLY